MNKEIVILFRITAVLLLLTALAKLITVFSGAEIYDATDFIFGLKYSHVFLLAGMLELLIAALLLSNVRLFHKATLSIWLGGSFCIYRLGLTALGVSHCPCLGSFSGAIGLDDSVTSSLLLGFALFLVGLGVWVLFNLHPSQPSKEALT